MLTERQSRILEAVIREYVDQAAPVGSQHISRTYKLDASPATIRNEMAELEEQGYLDHPHTSAGRVPTDQGYRFYVKSLMREEELPWEAQQTIRHQFHQIERGHEAWLHLAASVLAQAVENAAVVTPPRSDESRIKHLELVSLQEQNALLVLVLDQAMLKQQLVAFDEPHTQDELAAMAARLNHLFAGMSAREAAASATELTRSERLVMDAVDAMLRAVDEAGSDEAYLEGLRHVLSQPEFASNERVLGLLELLDERNLTRLIPLHSLAQEGVTVIIGADNPRLAGAGDAIQACTVIVSSYGTPDTASGALAVLGPTRMRYPRTISTVRYLSALMSELVSRYYA